MTAPYIEKSVQQRLVKKKKKKDKGVQQRLVKKKKDKRKGGGRAV